MIEIPISYKNFDNKEITEIYNFHLSYPEIAELETKYPEGFVEHFKKLIKNNNDIGSVLEFLKLLMMQSVGRRMGENGRRFVKDDDVRADFEQTGAYSALFIALATGEMPPEKFFNGIMPEDLHEKAAAMKKNMTPELTEKISSDMLLEKDFTPKREKPTLHQYTREELLEMSDEEFAALSRKHKNSLPQHFLVVGMERLTRKGE